MFTQNCFSYYIGAISTCWLVTLLSTLVLFLKNFEFINVCFSKPFFFFAIQTSESELAMLVLHSDAMLVHPLTVDRSRSTIDKTTFEIFQSSAPGGH